MSEGMVLISSIEEKVLQLLTQLEAGKKEMKVLQEKITELQYLIQEKDLLINNLETKAITQSPEKDNKHVEIGNRLDEILRDIDQCIGIMHP
ncbi:MAG TPA: hypothetical protein P5531_07755 [Bacteroidales bacterium]|nr:hypothetical protein [Bacteroidales bacterium]HSA43219.1 hypothetical protein [Bacteroidales bacterium]